jgi:flavin reductase
MTASKLDFRNAMARLGAAVNVVTTDGSAGRCGFTASAVCAITDEPPTVLVCMNRSSAQNPAFKANQVLCVNVLAPHHRMLSAAFAGQWAAGMADRFATGRWSTMTTGAPALDDAAVCIDGAIVEVLERGTHSMFLTEIRAVRIGVGEEQGLIWFGRQYHSIGHRTDVMEHRA